MGWAASFVARRRVGARSTQVHAERSPSYLVVSAQLGHSSTRITEDTYSHVTARLQREAGEAIERVLGT